MINETEKTSIDFAFEKLASQGLLVTKDYKNLVVYREAKEMHKQEVINAVDGFPLANRNLDGSEYYEKTYGGDK